MGQASSLEGDSGRRSALADDRDAPLAVFFGALLILATIYGALFVNTQRLLANSARVTQTYRVISRIDDLRTALRMPPGLPGATS